MPLVPAAAVDHVVIEHAAIDDHLQRLTMPDGRHAARPVASRGANAAIVSSGQPKPFAVVVGSPAITLASYDSRHPIGQDGERLWPRPVVARAGSDDHVGEAARPSEGLSPRVRGSLSKARLEEVLIILPPNPWG